MKAFVNRRPKPPDQPGELRALAREDPEMTDHRPRLFDCDSEIRRIGEGLIACTLPREDWTHEAHLAACLWIIRDRPDLEAERDLPQFIPRYNVSVGGVNSDTEGYHETITQIFIAAIRDHLAEIDPRSSLTEAVNTLLVSDRGRRDWPLRFYSRERLFSVEARRGFVAPDIDAFRAK